MINLRNSPFLWLTLVLLLAFSLGSHLDIFQFRWVYCLFGLIMLICGYGAFLKYNPSLIYVSTISISCLVFFAGIWRQSLYHHDLYPAPMLAKPILMEGMFSISHVLKSKETSISLQCEVLHLKPVDDTSKANYPDKYILIQIRNPVKRDIYPGDRIQLKSWISPIQGPLNPFAFDASVYYNTIGIRHQVTAKGEELIMTSSSSFSLNRLTAKWQAALSNKVKLHTSPSVAQVINALVWGDRSDMDADVRDAFANSGAMHVLSVSGMHVAMIYSMLFLLFGAPGDGVFLKRVIRFLLYATAILLYVGLTGACPAVVRAGLMILLFLFGKTMGWNTQIWNLLGFAAFMMLWLNPYVIGNIGFQLSFLAIAGILLFAKPIIRSLSFKSKVMHWMWEVVSLSLAAQVFIVPILLSQFHQFPLTFIISSIVAIPAGYIIIVGAIINVFLSFLGIDWLWLPLDLTGHYFIMSVKWMAGLNPAMNYSMTPAAGWMIFLMSIIFSGAVVYAWPKGKYIAYGFGISAILLLIAHRNAMWSNRELIIYHTFKGVLMDVSSGGYCYSFTAGEIPPVQVAFASRGYRCQRDVISTKTFNFNQNLKTAGFLFQHHTLSFLYQKLLIVENTMDGSSAEFQFTHLLITQADSISNSKKIICQHPDALVILAAALPRKSKNKLIYFLDENGIKYYDIAQSGFFRLQP